MAGIQFRIPHSEFRIRSFMDNNYQVYTRKWRPQTFEEIIGQEQVTVPLKSALEQKRVMHAYLFSGSRGVGKTTAARVFAKALNCETGPTPVPCNKCSSCLEITNGSSLDVLEIDGASNRGIEEMKKLREYVGVGTARSRYKIYIIDEVHMLTNEAFNALLKTLEEPPRHVIFIFATTDPQKMPSTIISRCQHFRFKRMPANLSVANLKMIAKNEKIEFEEEALYMIAKSADGALRDAQKVFDQAVTISGGSKITASLVASMLGEIGEEKTNALAEGIIKRDAARAVKIIRVLLEEGYDIRSVVRNLAETLRNILVFKSTGSAEALEAGAEEIKFFSEMAPLSDRERLLHMLQKVLDADIALKNTQMPGIMFESIVFDMALDRLKGTQEPVIEQQTPAAAAPEAQKAPAAPAVKAPVVAEITEPIYDAQKDPLTATGTTGARPSKILIEDITEEEEVKNLTAEIIKKRWENVVERAKSSGAGDDAVQAFSTAYIAAFEAGSLSLIGENPFFTDRLKNTLDSLKKALKEEFKQDVKISVFDKAEYDKRSQLKKEVTEEDALNNETVKNMEKVFGKFSEVKVIKHHKQ